MLAVGGATLTVTFTPTDTSKYASATATVSLTVTKAPLTVTAQAASKVYGAANPAFIVAYSGFVNGDTAAALGGTLAFATGATTSSAPGGYLVTPSGLTSASYTLSFIAGTLTVSAAPLTITAQAASRMYGAVNPTLTATYSGFVLGQTSSALGGTLSCTTTALLASAPGGYPITCSGQTATNYAITYAPGTLTISKATQAITLSPDPLPDRILGDAPFAITATASSGLAVTLAVELNGPCMVSGTTITLTAIGTCTVTASQGGNSNYLPATAVVRAFTIVTPPNHYLRGVNLAGAEFGEHALPGVYNQHYTYPTAAELDYYSSKGLTLIRLPFRWERLQHELYGPLDAAELGYMDTFVAAARARNMQVILDPHNYARYRDELIGTSAVPNAAFADFWQKVATHYKDETAIWAYGLMNEPHDTGGLWPAAAQAGVNAIRTVDQTHVILVPGDGWSGPGTGPRIIPTCRSPIRRTTSCTRRTSTLMATAPARTATVTPPMGPTR